VGDPGKLKGVSVCVLNKKSFKKQLIIYFFVGLGTVSAVYPVTLNEGETP